MRVEDKEAPNYNAVRLDNLENANRGILVLADDITGDVVYKDASGSMHSMQLGPHAIRIVRICRPLRDK
jgi:hypothetical protein